MLQCVCRKPGQCEHGVKEKKSMLYERNCNIRRNQKKRLKMKLRKYEMNGKMSLDLFYRDPYMLDFLGLT